MSAPPDSQARPVPQLRGAIPRRHSQLVESDTSRAGSESARACGAAMRRGARWCAADFGPEAATGLSRAELLRSTPTESPFQRARFPARGASSGPPSEHATIAPLLRCAPPRCTAPLTGWIPGLWLAAVRLRGSLSLATESLAAAPLGRGTARGACARVRAARPRGCRVDRRRARDFRGSGWNPTAQTGGRASLVGSSS